MSDRAERIAAQLIGGDSGESPSPHAGRPRKYKSDRERDHAKYVRRRDRERQKRGLGVEQPEKPVGDVTLWTFAGRTIWNVLGPIIKVRPLTDPEAVELGTAIAPVAEKYLPEAIGKFGAEITLLIVVAALYEQTKIRKGASDGEKPEVGGAAPGDGLRRGYAGGPGPGDTARVSVETEDGQNVDRAPERNPTGDHRPG